MLAVANAASLAVGAETTDGVISIGAAENVMAGISAILLKPEARFRLYSALSKMVTRGGGGARSAFIHDANGALPDTLALTAPLCM